MSGQKMNCNCCALSGSPLSLSYTGNDAKTNIYTPSSPSPFALNTLVGRGRGLDLSQNSFSLSFPPLWQGGEERGGREMPFTHKTRREIPLPSLPPLLFPFNKPFMIFFSSFLSFLCLLQRGDFHQWEKMRKWKCLWN